MLTKNDLNKIGRVIDERLEKKLDIKLKPIKTKLNKIDKKLDATINVFDTEVTNLKVRVDGIENKLELTPSSSPTP